MGKKLVKFRHRSTSSINGLEVAVYKAKDRDR
jgi:hypothetical protein